MSGLDTHVHIEVRTDHDQNGTGNEIALDFISPSEIVSFDFFLWAPTSAHSKELRFTNGT